MSASTLNPATGKQITFLRRLLDEAAELLDQRQALTGTDWPQARDAVAEMHERADHMDKHDASEAIDQAMDNNRQLRQELKGLGPVRTDSSPEEFVTTGMYRMDGRIYKVLPSRSSERHYAKELVGDSGTGYSFEYAKGAMYRIRPEHRMTAEEAAEFGTLTGSCCCCGKLLTDPKSIADGIGPVCKGKYF